MKRQQTLKMANSDLQAFLKDYEAAVKERRARPVDTASFTTEFDARKGPAGGSIDWAAVQKLVKILPGPPNASADRFVQVVGSLAAKS